MKVLGIILGIIGLVFIMAMLFAFPVMWLWNYLMPELFGLKEIGLWQSFCLLLLSGFLFRSGASTNKSES